MKKKGTMFLKKRKKGFIHFVNPSTNKTFAFIGRNYKGCFYAFGNPSDKGAKAEFYVNNEKEAENRILNTN